MISVYNFLFQTSICNVFLDNHSVHSVSFRTDVKAIKFGYIEIFFSSQKLSAFLSEAETAISEISDLFIMTSQLLRNNLSEGTTIFSSGTQILILWPSLNRF